MRSNGESEFVILFQHEQCDVINAMLTFNVWISDLRDRTCLTPSSLMVDAVQLSFNRSILLFKRSSLPQIQENSLNFVCASKSAILLDNVITCMFDRRPPNDLETLSPSASFSAAISGSMSFTVCPMAFFMQSIEFPRRRLIDIGSQPYR